MADTPSPHSPVALRQKRDHTIQVLCEHFANDNLEAEELEALIDRAHGSTTLAELDALLAGLPAAPAAGPMEHRREQTGLAPVRQQSLVVAVMGGAERRYDVLPSREINVIAVMGGVHLDFRNATFPGGVTELRIFALMGGVEVVVPADIQVDSSGIGIMGGFEHVGHGKFPVDLQRPVLRIVGVAIMGGVEITQRLQGESGREARDRRKYEERQRRLERGDRPEP